MPAGGSIRQLATEQNPRSTGDALVAPYETAADPAPRGRLDELVLKRLRQLGIRPSPLCSDEVFLRRAYLDVAGILPTPDEVRAFLADTSPEKRARVVDALLTRPEHADYWAMKWCDLLRVKAEFPINLWPNAVQAYHQWIRAAVRDNMRYDRFAYALLTASGSNFRNPPVNFYRAVQSRTPEGIARAVAQTFLGCRLERMPRERTAGLTAFFAQVGYKKTGEWKEEIVLRIPPRNAGGAAPPKPVFPDGKAATMPPGADPREVFARWLLAPGNPWFARNIANRLWHWVMGRGIVHEPDDFRPDNPPSNPELLAYLKAEVVRGGFDLRRVLRLLLNSVTYQRSPIPRSDHPKAAEQFAHYAVRRLEAETLIDAINQVTGTTESYSSAIPEPFTYLPDDQRAVAIADGSITSAFLELFGRATRDTGLEGDRNSLITDAQRLHLLNSSHIQGKIERGPTIAAATRGARNPREVVERLYMLILSRQPTAAERTIALQYFSAGARDRAAVSDLAWALINSAEFLHRH